MAHRPAVQIGEKPRLGALAHTLNQRYSRRFTATLLLHHNARHTPAVLFNRSLPLKVPVKFKLGARRIGSFDSWVILNLQAKLLHCRSASGVLNGIPSCSSTRVLNFVHSGSNLSSLGVPTQHLVTV